MFEKFKARFDLQKSDDAFVEAAINPNARQEMINKLVAARAKMSPLLTIMAVLYLFVALIEVVQLFIRDSSVVSHSSGAAYQGVTIVVLLVVYAGFDLQIKFLKALETGAKQVAPTEI